MTTFKNFIAGQWVEPSTGDYFQNVNPADTRDVIGKFPKSGAADVEQSGGEREEGVRDVEEDAGARARRRAAPCGRPARGAQGGDRRR